MKKIINFHYLLKRLILGALIFIGLSGCEKKETFDPNVVLGTEGSLSISNVAGTHSINLVSNQAWTAETDVDWITLSEVSGEKGRGTIHFSVSRNEDDERRGTITISLSENNRKEVTIIQEAGTLANYYIKENGTGEGKSWEDAANLADAFRNVTSGSTLHIAAGTYVPTDIITNGNPDDSRDKTFEINKYITIIGGYPANATAGAESDPANNKTLFSGKLPDGSEAYHVVTVTAPKVEGEKVVIDGLTISHGNGFDRGSRVTINGTAFARGNGGGMAIGNAIVDILNTSVVDNQTSGSGATAGYSAGIFAFGESVVTLRNTKVNDNVCKGNGGGFYADRSIAYIYDSEINGNSGGTAAGVHAFPDAEIYMYNSVIANNKGTSYGAGFYARQGSKGVLVNSLIYGNESTSTNGGGGVMMYDNTEVAIISSTVTGNKIKGPGGGVYRRHNTNKLSVYNSIISGNEQVSGSADVAAYEANAIAPVIQSSVIADKAFNASGSEIAGTTFNGNTMLNARYLPIGADNPALKNGMTGGALTSLAETFNPILEAFVASDFNGKSRSAFTIMGALVE